MFLMEFRAKNVEQELRIYARNYGRVGNANVNNYVCLLVNCSCKQASYVVFRINFLTLRIFVAVAGFVERTTLF